MTTATRTIRPYKGLGALSTVLEDMTMSFGPDVCQANKQLHLELHPHEFLVRPVQLEWAPDEAAFQRFAERVTNGLRAAELDPGSVEIVVVVKSSYLKLADIVFRWRASEIVGLPRRVPITRGMTRALSAPYSGFDIVVALVLACRLPRSPLKPFRKGTWLTRATFGVETRLSHIAFSPTPLTPEIRRELRIGARAMRFVDLDGYNVTEPAEEQGDPKFYVDSELLAQLNTRRSSPVSVALQTQLVIDFISAIIMRATEDDRRGLTYAEIRSSLLGSVIRLLAGEAAEESEYNKTLTGLLDNPSQAIANIEHVFNAPKMYLSALNSEEAS